MNGTTEMYEQKLLASEKEKHFPIITMDVEETTLIEMNLRGVKIGSLMVKVRKVEYSPAKEGFKIDLSVRNITPIES